MKLIEIHQQYFDFEKFKKDCAPYLKLLRGLGRELPYHGSNVGPTDFDIWDFKNRESSRDTPNDVHQQVNDAFEEKFGHRFRDWLFMTSNPRDARAYGKLNVVFPIGEFHYAWSPMIEDLTNSRVEYYDYRRVELRDTNPELSIDERTKIINKEFVERIKNTKYYLDEGFSDAIESRHEIMLSCKHLYIIGWSSDILHDIIRPYLEKAQ